MSNNLILTFNFEEFHELPSDTVVNTYIAKNFGNALKAVYYDQRHNVICCTRGSITESKLILNYLEWLNKKRTEWKQCNMIDSGHVCLTMLPIKRMFRWTSNAHTAVEADTYTDNITQLLKQCIVLSGVTNTQTTAVSLFGKPIPGQYKDLWVTPENLPRVLFFMLITHLGLDSVDKLRTDKDIMSVKTMTDFWRIYTKYTEGGLSA